MSNSQKLVAAIQRIKPTAQFVICDGDYSTIEWQSLEGKAPSKTEIEQEIKKMEAEDLAVQNAALAAKEAVLAKLGLTAQEAAALLA